MTTVGEFIREYREREGLSQGALARLMSHNGRRWYQQTVVKVEAGQRRVDLEEAGLLSRILRFSGGELFSHLPIPDPCDTCNDRPPTGFKCKTCGRSA